MWNTTDPVLHPSSTISFHFTDFECVWNRGYRSGICGVGASLHFHTPRYYGWPTVCRGTLNLPDISRKDSLSRSTTWGMAWRWASLRGNVLVASSAGTTQWCPSVLRHPQVRRNLSLHLLQLKANHLWEHQLLQVQVLLLLLPSQLVCLACQHCQSCPNSLAYQACQP